MVLFLILFTGCASSPGVDLLPESSPESIPKIEAYFFYEELCSICNESGPFFDILEEKLPFTERNQYPNVFYLMNVLDATGRAEYIRLTDEMGITRRDSLDSPLLILDGRAFQGYESISGNIKEAYFTAAKNLFP
jgi:hypothetical protein